MDEISQPGSESMLGALSKASLYRYTLTQAPVVVPMKSDLKIKKPRRR